MNRRAQKAGFLPGPFSDAVQSGKLFDDLDHPVCSWINEHREHALHTHSRTDVTVNVRGRCFAMMLF